MSTQTPEITDEPQTSSQTLDPATEAAKAISAGSESAARPRHPMPGHFPELRHIPEPKHAQEVVVVPAPVVQPVLQPITKPVEQVPVAPVIQDPHSVHDAVKSYQPERSVCVRCGSSNLSSGYVVDYGDQFRQVHFAPRRITLGRLNSLLNLWPFRGLAKLNAVACRDCGAVLLVVEPGELRRAERRRE